MMMVHVLRIRHPRTRTRRRPPSAHVDVHKIVAHAAVGAVRPFGWSHDRPSLAAAGLLGRQAPKDSRHGSGLLPLARTSGPDDLGTIALPGREGGHHHGAVARLGATARLAPRALTTTGRRRGVAAALVTHVPRHRRPRTLRRALRARRTPRRLRQHRALTLRATRRRLSPPPPPLTLFAPTLCPRLQPNREQSRTSRVRTRRLAAAAAAAVRTVHAVWTTMPMVVKLDVGARCRRRSTRGRR